MKIISKFRDYYDSVLAHGRDETLVYVRDRQVEGLALEGLDLPWDAAISDTQRYAVGQRVAFAMLEKDAEAYQRRPVWSISGPGNHLRMDEAFVVIAGKATPVWLRFDSLAALKGDQQLGDLGKTSLEEWAQHWKKERAEIERLYGRPTRPLEVVAHVKNVDKDKAATYDAARARFLERDFTALHLEREAPVLLLASPESFFQNVNSLNLPPKANVVMVRNPCLRELGIHKTIDPVTAFQSISQFIDGVVPGRQLPLVEISDQAQVVKKGFDPKYGFRTRPSR